MQIVIKIQESVIEHLKDGSFGARIDDRAALIDAVMNGTPLPNGHGGLIDVNIFRQYCFNKNFDKRLSDYALAIINLFLESQPTIIEADKAESEDKLDGNPVDIDKVVEHYEGTLEALKDIDLEVDG